MNSIDSETVQRKTFVSSVEWLDEVDSTNSHAINTITEREHFPLLVGANVQTSGRGRGGNQWWASAGSLPFSLVLAPSDYGLDQQQWPLMSLAVCLAIGEGLAPFVGSSTLQLKWPNDVYADGKKIAGILIETISTSLELVVIGIGINVNNLFPDAPVEVQNKACSVKDLTGESTSLENILISTLQSLEQTLQQFDSADSELLDRWRERCFLTGKQVGIDDSHRQSFGMCLGIDDDGALRLMTATGLQRFYAGTVISIDE